MEAETNAEIFRAGFHKDRDLDGVDGDEPENNGNQSLEDMQGWNGERIRADGETAIDPAEEEPQDQEAQEQEPEADEPEQEPQEQPDDRGFIPTGRLRENTEARRIAERENQELRERIARLEGAQQARQQQPPQPQQPKHGPIRCSILTLTIAIRQPL